MSAVELAFSPGTFLFSLPYLTEVLGSYFFVALLVITPVPATTTEMMDTIAKM